MNSKLDAHISSKAKAYKIDKMYIYIERMSIGWNCAAPDDRQFACVFV